MILGAIISHLIPSRNKRISKGELKEREALKSSDELGRGDAKEVSPFTNAQVVAAKDFIWRWMDEPNRKLIVGMATLSTHERHGLYVSHVYAMMQADKSKEGLIVKERIVISVPYMPQSNL